MVITITQWEVARLSSYHHNQCNHKHQVALNPRNHLNDTKRAACQYIFPKRTLHVHNQMPPWMVLWTRASILVCPTRIWTIVWLTKASKSRLVMRLQIIASLKHPINSKVNQTLVHSASRIAWKIKWWLSTNKKIPRIQIAVRWQERPWRMQLVTTNVIWAMQIPVALAVSRNKYSRIQLRNKKWKGANSQLTRAHSCPVTKELDREHKSIRVPLVNQ